MVSEPAPCLPPLVARRPSASTSPWAPSPHVAATRSARASPSAADARRPSDLRRIVAGPVLFAPSPLRGATRRHLRPLHRPLLGPPHTARHHRHARGAQGLVIAVCWLRMPEMS
uniref:Uncharacterized protein n=1 Tax=Zea mays TaxID=4577 RepID=B6U0I8_MAIZE|nr:hypothetical protein [Zea mays]|eukprot:NP_001144774.1 uncharacterized protein LOC100277837 [Zea mays]